MVHLCICRSPRKNPEKGQGGTVSKFLGPHTTSTARNCTKRNIHAIVWTWKKTVFAVFWRVHTKLFRKISLPYGAMVTTSHWYLGGCWFDSWKGIFSISPKTKKRVFLFCPAISETPGNAKTKISKCIRIIPPPRTRSPSNFRWSE